MSFILDILSTIILSFVIAYILTYAGMSIYAYWKYRKLYKKILKDFENNEELMSELREQMKQMRTKKHD